MTQWQDSRSLDGKSYVCYKCNKSVASDKGYAFKSNVRLIYLCPLCDLPTHFTASEQIPSPSFGQPVGHLPPDVASVYNEARECTSDRAFTAAVLACRKLLMHIAVERGAEAGKSFAHYVDYLAKKHFVPPGSEKWIDRIRTTGNEANHEIVLMKQGDAEDLINFLEMLLKFMYEFPGKIGPPVDSS